jgi:hypothetical protein
MEAKREVQDFRLSEDTLAAAPVFVTALQKQPTVLPRSWSAFRLVDPEVTAW